MLFFVRYALTKHADAAVLIMDKDSSPEEVYEMLPDAIEEFASCINIAKELREAAEVGSYLVIILRYQLLEVMAILMDTKYFYTGSRKNRSFISFKT